VASASCSQWVSAAATSCTRRASLLVADRVHLVVGGAREPRRSGCAGIRCSVRLEVLEGLGVQTDHPRSVALEGCTDQNAELTLGPVGVDKGLTPLADAGAQRGGRRCVSTPPSAVPTPRPGGSRWRPGTARACRSGRPRFAPETGEPKTDKGRRAVALAQWTVAELRTHRVRQLAEILEAGEGWHVEVPQGTGDRSTPSTSGGSSSRGASATACHVSSSTTCGTRTPPSLCRGGAPSDRAGAARALDELHDATSLATSCRRCTRKLRPRSVSPCSRVPPYPRVTATFLLALCSPLQGTEAYRKQRVLDSYS